MPGKGKKAKQQTKPAPVVKPAAPKDVNGVENATEAEHVNNQTAAEVPQAEVAVESTAPAESKTEGVAADEDVAKAGDSESASSVTEAKATEDTEMSTASAVDKDSQKVDPGEEDEPPLYPVIVKGPGGEEFELQVSPVDTSIDLRQFIADAPETCFYTCYDLVLMAADGTKFHLFDEVLVKEVTDISKGGCTLELIPGLYTDQGVRYHVKRMKDLMSLEGCHLSHATQLAIEYGISGKEDGDESAEPKPTIKPAKGDVPELEGMGFMEETSTLLTAVLPPVFEEGDCIKSIAYSSFNPVPGTRRLMGDLMYFDAETNEGEHYCITAHTKGFFVNRSKGDVLDPEPADPPVKSDTLVGLLRSLSPAFTTGLNNVINKKASIHPFEGAQQVVGAIPWLGNHLMPAHRRDMGRAEEVMALPYGGEVAGLQRDWNEELQSVREMPQETLNDRMLRDRNLHRVQSDFVDAAIKGVKAVVGRCIPPINPGDHDRFHLYVHNNIFFSLAVDGDFAMMQMMREAELAEIAKKEASAKGEDAPAAPAAPEKEKPKDGKEAPAPEAEATGDSAPKVVEGAEQVTYASANNDLKGAMAVNRAGVSGLNTLAVAVIDYRGHRCIAQSIVPGILYNKQETLIYGSVDGGKKVVSNEKFHEKAMELAKALHLSPSTIIDGEGKEFDLAIAADCKGIRGMDDRQYILDLARTTPRDANYTGPGSKTMLLRPELVAVFVKAEQEERYKALVESDSEAAKKTRAADIDVRLNPIVFTDAKLGGDLEVIAAEEKLVKKAAAHLLETALPKLVADLESLDVTPLDGHALAELMHSRGINIRYLGKLAKLVDHLSHVKALCLSEMIMRSAKHVFKAVLRETMDHDVGGALVHLLNCFIGAQPEEAATAAAPPDVKEEDKGAGEAKAKVEGEAPKEKAPEAKGKRNSSPSKGGKGKKKGGKGNAEAQKPVEKTKDKEDAAASVGDAQTGQAGASSEADASKAPAAEMPEFGYQRITGTMVWSDVREATKFKYGYILPSDICTKYRKLSTLRSLCIELGLTMAAKTYDLESPKPFESGDILDMQPVAKFGWPVSMDAERHAQAAKALLAQVDLPLVPTVHGTPRPPQWFKNNEAKLNEAYNNLNDACNILTNICGPLWPDVAELCRLMATVQFHAGNPEAAVHQQHRELVINERLLGLDHPTTAKSYANMALFYHGLGHTDLALKHVSRALQLLTVATGKDHPDCASLFITISMLYQDNQKFGVALRYLQEALTRNEKLLGPDHLQVAFCYHALALSFMAMGAYKMSHKHEKSAYNILVSRLGENDTRTREAALWLQEFQARELQAQMKKQSQRGELAAQQAVALRAAQDIQTQEMLRILQAASAANNGAAGVAGAAAAAAARAAAARSQGQRPAAMPREATPGLRARGVDERAARATAEARKKAERKGLNVRPGAGAGAAATGAAAANGKFEDLLSFINHGLVNAAARPSGSTASTTAKPGGAGGVAATKTAAAVAGGAPSPKGEPVVRKGWTGDTGSPSTSGQTGEVEPTSLGDPAVMAGNGHAEAPLGLGVGLSDMEVKKKKAKAKKAGVAN